MTDIPRTVLYRPHQCGWLRRPECDYPRMEAWEKPNGELHIHDPKLGVLLLTYMSGENLP